ncbi:MAG: response regulator [Eubacteriales bacterium]|nr:response regulator [Eubacteriales bacterium]
MNFHLLIVDDEATMRKGLSSFIHWEAIDCTVSATACNGAEAIAMMQEYPVDIVITDIKMPEMDGLTLSRYIYENRPEIAVILLTGYAEFEYARSAIRYNVTQFLVKPTSKDEIVAAVKEAQQRIIVSKKQDTIARSELAFLKDQFLQELIYTPVVPEILRKLETYGLDLEHYCIAAFQLLGPPSHVNQLKELIIRQKVDSYCFRYNNLILSLYFHPALDSVVDNCAEIVRILDELYALPVSVGISRFHGGAESFQTAASEAIRTLSLNFYSDSSIAVFSGQNIQSGQSLPAETALSLYELETAMLNRDFTLAVSIVESLFMKLQSSFADASEVKAIGSQIYCLAFRVLAKAKLLLPPEDFPDQISRASDIFQLESVIRRLLSTVQDGLTSSDRRYSPHVRDAAAYIQAHLSESLSLEDIARHAHVNDSYLSRTFKKECGYSITEYITTLRIEKAKELLSDHHILTYEVSSRVGIQDPSYFSLLFKKHTGLSPKEYRNQFVP